MIPPPTIAGRVARSRLFWEISAKLLKCDGVALEKGGQTPMLRSTRRAAGGYWCLILSVSDPFSRPATLKMLALAHQLLQ